MKTLLLLVFAVASAQFVYGQKSLNLGLLSDFDKSDQRNSASAKNLLNRSKKVSGALFPCSWMTQIVLRLTEMLKKQKTDIKN